MLFWGPILNKETPTSRARWFQNADLEQVDGSIVDGFGFCDINCSNYFVKLAPLETSPPTVANLVLNGRRTNRFSTRQGFSDSQTAHKECDFESPTLSEFPQFARARKWIESADNRNAFCRRATHPRKEQVGKMDTSISVLTRVSYLDSKVRPPSPDYLTR